MTGELEQSLVLDGRAPIAAGVVELTLRRPDRRSLPPWTPGAHIDLVLDDQVVRQYSLCGDPAEASAWRVAVLREDAGRGGSIRVHDELVLGSEVLVRGPRNHFDLLLAERYLFIAGGIGITPIVPMLQAAQHRGADFSLLYGGRARASMAYADTLQEKYGDRVQLRPQDEFGLLDLDAVLGEVRTKTLVYCCGPEPLLHAIEAAVSAWPRGSLHVERFAARPGATDGERRPFDLILAQSNRTVAVRADCTALQALLDAGVPILHSCTEGTCGTCETGVLDGEVDHRDSLLTEDERAAMDTMFVCVSRARGQQLVLDL